MMTKRKLAVDIIEGYHQAVRDRYRYHKIKEKYGFPDSVSEEKFDTLRKYFLTYMYPSADRRIMLNEAFESLDGHLKNPQQLLRIAMDSSALIFKYGWHLPKIMKSGLKALKSFRHASEFEWKLHAAAEKRSISPPFSVTNIQELMTSLSRTQINQFMEDGLALFNTLYDRDLVAKIIEIIRFLIGKMKKRPKVYSSSEVLGLQYGLEAIEQGDSLFNGLNKEEQSILFDLVYRIEKDNVDEIFQMDLSN